MNTLKEYKIRARYFLKEIQENKEFLGIAVGYCCFLYGMDYLAIASQEIGKYSLNLINSLFIRNLLGHNYQSSNILLD